MDEVLDLTFPVIDPHVWNISKNIKKEMTGLLHEYLNTNFQNRFIVSDSNMELWVALKRKAKKG